VRRPGNEMTPEQSLSLVLFSFSVSFFFQLANEMGSCRIITGFFGLISNRVVLLFFLLLFFVFSYFPFYTERNETRLGCPPPPIKSKTKGKEKKNLGAPLRGHYYYEEEEEGKKNKKKRKEIKYQIVEKEGKRTMRTTSAHSNLETLEWVADKLFISSQVRETP
jgi:hypothetical protein